MFNFLKNILKNDSKCKIVIDHCDNHAIDLSDIAQREDISKMLFDDASRLWKLAEERTPEIRSVEAHFGIIR